MTRKLNYVNFSVSDMQKAVDFYRTLGLPIPADVDTTQETPRRSTSTSSRTACKSRGKRRR